MSDLRPCLKTSDVMRLLNMRTPEAVYSLVQSKRLAAIRVGRAYRFTPESVEAFCSGVTVEQLRERKARRAASLPPWANVPQRIK